MAKKFMGTNTLTSLIKLIKTDLFAKINKSDRYTDPTFTAEITEDSILTAQAGKALNDKISTLTGGLDNIGDTALTKAIYDTDDDGVVDDSQKLGGNLPDYYATAQSVSDLIATKGKAEGIAPLDASGIISSEFLPSYVDDVIEGWFKLDGEGNSITSEMFKNKTGEDGAAVYEDAITPEAGKIYIDLQTNNSYRWSGSTYILITSSDLVEINEADVTALWNSTTVDSSSNQGPHTTPQ